MNNKSLSAIALVASILIFIASFLGSAKNGNLYISAITAGGIWYLLPVAGLIGIVFSSLSLAGKTELKVPAFIIGGMVLAMGAWFAMQAQNGLDQIVIMQNEMSQGFNSYLFTGKHQDTSALPKSSLGAAFFMYVIAGAALITTGFLHKNEKIS